MKLLLENWREYLNEGNFDLQSFKSLPQAVRTPQIDSNQDARLMVVIDVPGHGPTAFYRSTGTGTPQLGTENMWLPAGGYGYYKGNLHLAKFEKSGKVPPAGHIMHDIGVRLGKAYDKKPFPETPIWSWVSSKGFPSLGDYQKAGRSDLVNLNQVYYFAYLTNAWLNGLGALKPQWAVEGLMGAKDDKLNPPFKQLLADIEQALKQGSQQ
tara:strand:- start:173 stop:802 length:630 start_codon:yes stop_codon:yes gene_type:complete